MNALQKLLVLMPALLSLPLVGCDRFSSHIQANQQNTSAASAPLETFKLIADRCLGAIADSDTTVEGRGGGFYRSIIKIGKKSYDVVKTDSLVSPFLAHIEVEFSEQTGTADSPAALVDASSLPLNWHYRWRLLYAMQDGAWLLKEEISTASTIPDIGVEPATQNQVVGTLAKRVPLASACSP